MVKPNITNNHFWKDDSLCSRLVQPFLRLNHLFTQDELNFEH